ncbi:TetR/AcrR family transcriptional regulator [Paenibacillus hexagrammi]|uniref:TetR/AcrR family transcriptional regulator n=1 Tax=Paenibacillus hexagrammi TaxID=2908839 RepID=A0ABY3SG96_9BACL|nr:TetR/AcrR family transcriptional regulator [Paenibacillus sp. YPD9-1]UJF32475.1 TetR/AcrR family transcriptional regulator [Paenibacillus sp. YPD9-1]
MPKFTEQEKEHIYQCMLTKGKELFIQYGLAKTSIDDIVLACGIAKGSFYKFFSSKEELYFAVLKNEEGVRNQLLSELLREDLPPKERMSSFFHKAYQLADENPFLQNVFQKGDYERLVRKLPEHLQQSSLEDMNKGVEVMKSFIRQGSFRDDDAELAAGVMRAVLMLRLHKDQLGAESFSPIIDKIIEYVSEGMTRPKEPPKEP